MKTNWQERATVIALYIKSTHATIRDAAELFGVSKSTAHLDVSKRLKKINPKLSREVGKILQENFNEKHIRGGESTRQKYLYQKSQKKCF